MQDTLTGNAAIALGARDAGLEVLTGYPGSPATTVFENLMERREDREIHAEWSANEKVAFEVAMGGSIAGARSMVCIKSVGFNVGLDPLTNFNLTGCNGGFVILLGDDPGGWGSQNEQDGRLLAAFAEIPILEPSTPREGYDMALFAFDLSEKHAIPVMIRITRKYSTTLGPVELLESIPVRERKKYHRPEKGWISVPQHIIEHHEELRRKNLAIAREFETAPFNRISVHGRFGIICSGHAATKVEKVLDSHSDSALSVMKLGTVNPLPCGKIEQFLSEISEVLICEDNHPFVEKGVSEIAGRSGIKIEIYGRLSEHFPWPGELSESDIHATLSKFMQLTSFEEGDAEPFQYGTLKPFPQGCPNINIFDALKDAMDELGAERPIVVGDSGCGVRSMSLPYRVLDVKLCMGSSVGVACGLLKGGIDRKVVALVGDSSFFHTALPSIFNAIHHKADVMIVILHNHTTATTGRQPHPGTGDTAVGSSGVKISMEAVLRAAGIGRIKSVDTGKRADLKEAFKEGLNAQGIAVIIANGPCPMLEQQG